MAVWEFFDGNHRVTTTTSHIHTHKMQCWMHRVFCKGCLVNLGSSSIHWARPNWIYVLWLFHLQNTTQAEDFFVRVWVLFCSRDSYTEKHVGRNCFTFLEVLRTGMGGGGDLWSFTTVKHIENHWDQWQDSTMKKYITLTICLCLWLLLALHHKIPLFVCKNTPNSG